MGQTFATTIHARYIAEVQQRGSQFRDGIIMEITAP
jgi:hypothetical protein